MHFPNFKNTIDIIKFRGLGYPFYLVTRYFIPKIGNYLLYHYSPRILKRIFKVVVVSFLFVSFVFSWIYFGFLPALVAYSIVGVVIVAGLFIGKQLFLFYQTQKTQNLFSIISKRYPQDTFLKINLLPIPEDTLERILITQKSNATPELVIGNIDRDNRVFGVYGDIPILPQVSASDFVPRSRYTLEIVLIDQFVLIKKDFRGDRRNFINEWKNLCILFGKVNVPPVYCVDQKKAILYKGLILGPIVRDILMNAGARLMITQLADDPEAVGLNKHERLTLVNRRGTELVGSCLSDKFLRDLEIQIDAIHAVGITGIAPTFSNVIVEKFSGCPFLIDFEGARYHNKRNILFYYHRNEDRKKFNKRYNRQILTEESVRNLLNEKELETQAKYAPIDFGRGLATNGFWSINSGTGRWHIIKNVVTPLIQQKTILDLGSNNGILPIYMLRNGAKKVVGIELSESYFNTALLTKQIFEWNDIYHYDFELHKGNMLEILESDWGKFDLITAFCSLYYLNDDEMAQVIRQASKMAPVCVLEANISTRSDALEEKQRKSSLQFLHQLLKENGFPSVEVFKLNNYNRPLLIGRKQENN